MLVSHSATLLLSLVLLSVEGCHLPRQDVYDAALISQQIYDNNLGVGKTVAHSSGM